MIYLDTSVALAHLLGEDRSPPASLWDGTLVSSRLLEYEVRTRLHALGLGSSHRDAAAQLLGRVAFVRLEPTVLARAVEPFPRPVRTLDALHLSTVDYLVSHGQSMVLASYDARMIDVANALGWAVYPCG
ncbi:MAG: PIN domain-containing protein [Planctomycetes bacterium]|nr:PIN domain-containing protein [Planctomycetota bacterium]